MGMYYSNVVWYILSNANTSIIVMLLGEQNTDDIRHHRNLVHSHFLANRRLYIYNIGTQLLHIFALSFSCLISVSFFIVVFALSVKAGDSIFVIWFSYVFLSSLQNKILVVNGRFTPLVLHTIMNSQTFMELVTTMGEYA